MTATRSVPATATGLLLAATGVAHFVVPDAFLALTRVPHPVDTAAWGRRDGAVETVVGLAVAHPRTRRLGVAALLGYGAWLGVCAVRAR